MIDKSLLLVEDNASSGFLLKELLNSKGYNVKLAQNGHEALNFFNENRYKVVITDLKMPVMDGGALIDRLQGSDTPPVIIVLTAYNTPGTIIDIMKKDIFEYFIKPVNSKELVMKLNRAFDIFEMKKSINIKEKEKFIRLEEQLEWFKFVNKSGRQNSENLAEPLFHNLNVNFSQGAGFGALVRLIQVLASSATKQGDNYIIDKDLFDVIIKNAEIAEKALEFFSDIEKIIHKDISLEKTDYSDYYKLIHDTVKETNIFASEKGQTIIMGDPRKDCQEITFSISNEYFKKALKEILINSIKFSEKNSHIILLTDIQNNNFVISILSKPLEDERGRFGIPIEYENLVFEPFFRLTKRMPGPYGTLNFGLGLTMVQKIILKHGGETAVSNIRDHSSIKFNPVDKVNFTISMPFN